MSESYNELRQRIESFSALKPEDLKAEASTAMEVFREFKCLLNSGKIRSAEKQDGRWQANAWVKQGILLGMKLGGLQENTIQFRGTYDWTFIDKDTYPLKRFRKDDGVRIVPGGSSVRDGSYLAPSVVMMPPAYVNVGAYVDEGTMIDSHALVGSCAQVGRNVHLSAAVQIGGVLEPVGAVPVVIEDDVMVGGNCGIYEGTVVSSRAVIGTGVILNASTPVYDIPNERVIRKTSDQPLIIPEGAVVIAGSRPAKGAFAEAEGLSVYTPIIVKYRDEKTDSATALESALR